MLISTKRGKGGDPGEEQGIVDVTDADAQVHKMEKLHIHG